MILLATFSHEVSIDIQVDISLHTWCLQRLEGYNVCESGCSFFNRGLFAACLHSGLNGGDDLGCGIGVLFLGTAGLICCALFCGVIITDSAALLC